MVEMLEIRLAGLPVLVLVCFPGKGVGFPQKRSVGGIVGVVAFNVIDKLLELLRECFGQGCRHNVLKSLFFRFFGVGFKGSVKESHNAVLEGQGDQAGGAVTVFCDDNLSLSLILPASGNDRRGGG
ncbi:MAG: hypothetical protein U5N26_06060 [Candidatus Marinimicrobia bacterium]|nr:hypothetical protein [Candidatus Neomarinimicrobiota bacterium]